MDKNQFGKNLFGTQKNLDKGKHIKGFIKPGRKRKNPLRPRNLLKTFFTERLL